MKFTIKKIPVSEEEKRERAEFFEEETGVHVDIEEFLKKIYMINSSTLNVLVANIKKN